MPSTWWTEDRTEMLKRLWASGSFSFSQIAGQMDITRNAVIGKAHRLGFNGRVYGNTKRTPEQIEASKRRKAERRNERRRTERVHMVRPTINLEALRCVEVVPLHKSLIDLGSNDCRYPYGDGPYTFCGHPQLEGHSYCGPHFGLSARRGQS